MGVPKAEFEHAHIHDVHIPEWITWTPMLLLIVALGIVPGLLFHTTDGAVRRATSAIPPAQTAVAQQAPSP